MTPIRSRAPARRWLVAALVLVALVAALLAAATWGPNLMRERIARAAGDALGRAVSIGRIDVSPFAGLVAVSDLSVASPDPARPAATVEALRVDWSWGALLRGAVVLPEVAIDAPALRVVRTAPGRFDFDDVVERLSKRPAPEDATRPGTVWRVGRLRIARGSLAFDDRVVRRTATLDALELEASGLTNRAEDAEVPAALRAAFALDGRPASIEASATPFAARPAAAGTVSIDALPVASVLPWLPLPADLRPVAGALGATLKFDAQAAAAGRVPGLQVSGPVTLTGARIVDAAGTERVAASALSITLAASRPLEGRVHVAEIALRSPRLVLARGADGRLEWPRATAASTPASASPPSASASTSPAPAPDATRRSTPVALTVDALRVDDGALAWSDASTPVPIALSVAPLSLRADGVSIPDLARPTAASGRAKLEATLDGDTRVEADATAEDGRVRARASVAGLPLARWAPLAGAALRATVERGRLDVRAGLDWNAADGTWSVSDAAAELADLRLAHASTKPATLRRLAIEGVAVDGAARRVEIGALTLDGAVVDLRRERDGRIDLAAWIAPRDSAPAANAPAANATATDAPSGDAPAPPPWSLTIRRLEAGGVDVGYTDAAIRRSRSLPRVALAAKATDVTLDPGRPIALDASVSLADGSQLALAGTVRPQPLAVDGRLRLRRVGLTHAAPYVAPYLNVALASGQLWGAGQIAVATDPAGGAPRVRWDGELSVNEFRAIDRRTSVDFVRWSALALPSVKVDWNPARVADSVVDVGPVAIVDFYARIILGPDGRLNLASVVTDPASRDAPRSLTSVDGPTAKAPVSSERTATVPAARPGPRPTIRVGQVRIASGDVEFTDLFVRPNYSAHLTGLVGSIDAIASDRASPADVLITGRVDDDTPLEIVGKIDPLGKDRYADVRAVARGFDLPKLSPYSGRWAGYAIEKGKLTADVRYRIEGDALRAENRVVINQLTFGERIESPDATSLPVRLAVSLLKDRQGNIDLDLPISGTISDPEFSVGGLIWRALGNLIVKVVSSPFSVLASLGGGGAEGAELSHVEFAAGDAELDDEDRRRLDTLAKALRDRPALSIEIAGVADPAADREAMQRESLERTLKSAKLARMRRATPTAELPALSDVVLDPSERPALLEQAWRDGAPRGAKIPEGADLERLLIERAPVATEDVRSVAQERAQAARDYLHETGGIAAERLYLLAPRIAEPGDSKPPTRADFAVR